MSLPIQLTITESLEELKTLYKNAATHQRPRLKMLLCIKNDIHKNESLAAKTGAGVRSIVRWKKSYQESGIQSLLSDSRGQTSTSQIDAKGKMKLEAKLSDSHNGFTTYIAIQDWIAKELGVNMNYAAVYMY